MDRTERLLDLVALFLDARAPVSWSELKETFPGDYDQGSPEAAERKFERDKAELLELGIPLSYVTGDDDTQAGYVVERNAYYLPEAGLTAEELAVLCAAGSAALSSGAFPAKSDLAHALRKMGVWSDGEVAAPKVRMELGAVKGGPELSATLESLWTAISSRKSIQLSYLSPKRETATTASERKVDPYGVALRRGIWSLVGFCHLRQAVRTFHVHRIKGLTVNASRPKTADFEVPADFDLDRYVARYPWQHRFHPPLEVELRLRGALREAGSRLFPDGQTASVDDRESSVLLRVTYLDGLLRSTLAMGPDCRVVGPPQAVEGWRAMLGRVVERHTPSPDPGGPQ